VFVGVFDISYSTAVSNPMVVVVVVVSPGSVRDGTKVTVAFTLEQATKAQMEE
jgi:hypothetical protein